MKSVYLVAIIASVLIVSYIYGSSISEQCVAIESFKGCWSSVPKTVSSDLCPKSPCTAKPELQQHNAVADVLLQACQKARNENYASHELNRRIEEVLVGFTGYSIDAQTLCDQPGVVLTQRRYE